MRSFASVLVLIALSACTQTKETTPIADPMSNAPAMSTEKPLPKTDIQTQILSNMSGGSVTVFPMEGPARDPFDNRGLQPLSQKVLADGYVVTDPSVNVYPPRPPVAMPESLPMEGGIRTDAASAIAGARHKAADATQLPPISDEPNVFGGRIVAEPLDAQTVPMPPRPDQGVIGANQSEVGAKPMGWVGAPPLPAGDPSAAWGSNVTPAPTVSAPPMAGMKSGPVDTGYSNAPVVTAPLAPLPPVNNTPALQAPRDVPVIRPGMLTSDTPAGMPTIERIEQ